YLVRREPDGSTEASLVRALVYPSPAARGRTRIHITPERLHMHAGFGPGSPDPRCDWDFSLYRDGPVAALCRGLPARLIRELELGRADDVEAIELDRYERPADEPYWPSYRC